jgi:hypothetical protein
MSHLPYTSEKHALSSAEWDFTGRVRYTGETMELEVRYSKFDIIGHHIGFWNRLFNGNNIWGYVVVEEWVNADYFHFKELPKTVIYECGCSCPEVTYDV